MSNQESRVEIIDLLAPRPEVDAPPMRFRSEQTSPGEINAPSIRSEASAPPESDDSSRQNENEAQVAFIASQKADMTADRLREQQLAPRITERGPVSRPPSSIRNATLLAARTAKNSASATASNNNKQNCSDSIELITKKDKIQKWGSDSFYMSGVFNYDSGVKPELESNWCRAFIQASRQMPIRLRIVAAEPGNLSWNTHVRTHTEQGSGNVLSITQIVCHAAPALTDENRFRIYYDSPQFLRTASTATVREFKVNADSVDLRAASNLISAKLSLDRLGSLALAECVSFGLDIADTCSWYAKLWLMFFHLSWMEEQGLVVQPQAPAVESCVAVSFAGAPAETAAAVTTVATYCTTEKLVVFEQDFDITMLRVFWAAANGLPRFATPAADPPRVCLLDGLTVPSDPVCFVRVGLPVLPGVGPMTSEQVLRAIAILTGIRNEHRFSLSGFYRASLYYNRWRPVDNRGNAQYFSSTLEWRMATWHMPKFTNSLLVYLNRISLPHHQWAENELRKLLAFGGGSITDSSVWLSAAVCISYSTALSVFNIKGSDLVGVYRNVDRFEYRGNVGIIQRLSTRRNGEVMPPLSTTAAIIRKQMGLPSLGGDVFCVSSWQTGWRYTADVIVDGAAWDTVWSHSIPYVLDPLTILWMCEEYSALWHIPRAPVTYKIVRELHKGGRGGEARFIPSLGDDIITNFNVDAFYSPAAPYVPMLLGILSQSTRLEMPLPSFWMTWSPTTMLMTQLPADDRSIPDFTFSQDTMTIRAGTGVMYDWRDNCYTSPVWNRRDLDDAWWERISSIGIDRRPAIGIEPVDHIYDHSVQPSVLDEQLPFGGWAQSNELGRESNEESHEDSKRMRR